MVHGMMWQGLRSPRANTSIGYIHCPSAASVSSCPTDCATLIHTSPSMPSLAVPPSLSLTPRSRDPSPLHLPTLHSQQQKPTMLQTQLLSQPISMSILTFLAANS